MTEKPVFTLRMNPRTLERIKTIAKYSKRSTAMQIEYAVEKFIDDFIKVNGDIEKLKVE